MKILKSVKVYGKTCNIVISDDDVALREAEASLKATISILGYKSMEIALSKYAVTKFDDIDEDFLKLVACRHLNFPVTIGNMGEITIREMGFGDMEVLAKFQEFPFKTAEEFKEYIPVHYDLYGYGLYVIERNKVIIGLAGFYNENSKCFISYMILSEYRNQGYALRVCKYLLEYLREKTEIESVYAKIEKNNKVSIKLAKKLGVKIIIKS